MMDRLSLKYRILLAAIAISFVVCLFLGSSYALWQIQEVQKTENVIDSGCFNVTFTDESEKENNYINLPNAYPISDQQGLKLVPYTFIIKNECTVDAEYTLYLNVLKINVDKNQKIYGKIPDNKIKYSLKKSTDANAVVNLITSETTINPDKEAFKNPDNIETSYIIDEGILKGSSAEGEVNPNLGSVSYELRLWIDESATTDINYDRFEAQVATIARAINK